MAEEHFQVVSSEPRLAKLLHKREPLIVPSDLYHFVVDYVEDVGAVIRSREYKVSILATGATYALLIGATKLLPILSEFGVLSEAFGIRR